LKRIPSGKDGYRNTRGRKNNRLGTMGRLKLRWDNCKKGDTIRWEGCTEKITQHVVWEYIVLAQYMKKNK